ASCSRQADSCPDVIPYLRITSLKALRDNLPLRLHRPTPPPRAACDHLNPCRRSNHMATPMTAPYPSCLVVVSALSMPQHQRSRCHSPQGGLTTSLTLPVGRTRPAHLDHAGGRAARHPLSPSAAPPRRGGADPLMPALLTRMSVLARPMRGCPPTCTRSIPKMHISLC